MKAIDIEPRVTDAYRYPQRVRPGCQHQLGCKCERPYWLRASSPAEEARESRMRPASSGEKHGG